MRRDDPSLEAVPPAEPLAWPPAEIVAALAPLLSARRRARFEHVVSERTTRVVPVLEGLVDPHNMSAILRSCEAFGFHQVRVIELDQPLRTARNISKGADRWLTIEKFTDSTLCFEQLTRAGRSIWLATADGAQALESLPRDRPIAVVFGNERSGPSETAIRFAEGSFFIPMRGFVESLNVSVAAAVTLHALRGSTEGDLTAVEQEALFARYLLKTVRDPMEALRRHRLRDAERSERGLSPRTRGKGPHRP